MSFSSRAATRMFLTFALPVWLAAGAAAEPGLPPPNILLLVAEDLSPRIASFGDPVAHTPHIDALAEQGVRYSHVFTSAGVCAPSRAALVTGHHAISFGAQHMRTSTRPAGGYTAVPPAGMVAFPELLRAAGYYTYTDEKLDYQFSGVLSGSGPFTIWDDEGRGTHWPSRPDDRPFFGLVNFQITHESGVFTPLGSWPHSATHLFFQGLRALQFGFDVGTGPIAPGDVSLPPYYPDSEIVRADVARHYNNVHAMDAQVGRLLAQLEADGLADSTIVIWTTDHGDGLPRAKRELYDSGLHVPMIVRWPERYRPARARPGSWDHRLVSFVDLAPTMLEFAGVEVPSDLPGRSFAAAGASPRQYVFAARDRIDDVMDRQRAARDTRFKYIRSYQPEQPGGHESWFRDNIAMARELRQLFEAGELNAVQRLWFEPPGEERLYDTASDPHELADLSRDPEYAVELARMRLALDDWLARVGDSGDQAEDVLAARFWPGGEQPVTAPPTLDLRRDTVAIHASLDASVGFRMDAGAWQLYSEPIRVTPGTRIEARAVRYGWKESDTVELSVP